MKKEIIFTKKEFIGAYSDCCKAPCSTPVWSPAICSKCGKYCNETLVFEEKKIPYKIKKNEK